MGTCISSTLNPYEVTKEDKRRHAHVEKTLQELSIEPVKTAEKLTYQRAFGLQAKGMLDRQRKLLLLGPGDSGKSTVLKQMRLLHGVGFSTHEVESFRQLIFDNITRGMIYVLESMEDMGLHVDDDNIQHIATIVEAQDIKDGEAFPAALYQPMKSLWEDSGVQKALARGNEAALPDNLTYFFSSLDRLFDPTYQPVEQDIIRTRARTLGITETEFKLRNHSLLVVDVGGQKSERRKWIHCFQDVTCLLFLASLSGYDQCLVEDKDANEMDDAMMIWGSICHSLWFKDTSIILFLNKSDIFEAKVAHSSIKRFFSDFDGPVGDAKAGRDFFKRRFASLAQKSGQANRSIYMHITNATDTALLQKVIHAVEGEILKSADGVI